MLAALFLFLFLVALFVGVVGCLFSYLYGVAKAFQPYLKERQKWEDLKAQLDKAWEEKEKSEKERGLSNLNC